MAKPLRDIPTHVITGSLGVGKTTTILSQLESKPKGERWAVLVNEFGQVGLDGALLEPASTTESGVTHREVVGGCICCAMGVPFKVALTQMLRKERPDRVVIEPTGLGHPAQILDHLQSPDFKKVLQLKAVITLIDPLAHWDLWNEGNETYRDQINVADIVVINKVDLVDEAEVQRLMAWGQELFPMKQKVVSAEKGKFDPELLLHSRGAEYTPLFTCNLVFTPEGASKGNFAEKVRTAFAEQQPALFIGSDTVNRSFGFVFPPEWVFDIAALRALLADAPVPLVRAKGCFKIGPNRYVALNGNPQHMEEAPSVWRQDSRVMLICKSNAVEESAGEELQTRLLATVVDKPVVDKPSS